jgi:3-oxoacyl-[acyl-carrier protein] reductase
MEIKEVLIFMPVKRFENELKGKTVVITGAAGGIGSSLVESFTLAGSKCILIDIDRKGLNSLKTRFDDISIYPADISSPKIIKKTIGSIIRRYRSIDVLINAAAIQKPIGSFIEVSENEWIKTIEMNLIGTALCCKYVLPVMVRRRRGKIINFSGGGATFPRANFSAYAVSKTAIVRLTEILAQESEAFNVQVNAVAPGPVNTKMTREIIAAGSKSGKNDLELAQRTTLAKNNSLRQTNELVLFLASSRSGGITGKLLSSVWDKLPDLSRNSKGLKGSSLYTLRRIDGNRYFEKR